LAFTSCEDLKSSLHHVTNINVLMGAAALCRHHGYKTKLTMIRQRIKQISEKGTAKVPQRKRVGSGTTKAAPAPFSIFLHCHCGSPVAPVNTGNLIVNGCQVKCTGCGRTYTVRTEFR